MRAVTRPECGGIQLQLGKKLRFWIGIFNEKKQFVAGTQSYREAPAVVIYLSADIFGLHIGGNTRQRYLNISRRRLI